MPIILIIFGSAKGYPVQQARTMSLSFNQVVISGLIIGPQVLGMTQYPKKVLVLKDQCPRIGITGFTTQTEHLTDLYPSTFLQHSLPISSKAQYIQFLLIIATVVIPF